MSDNDWKLTPVQKRLLNAGGEIFKAPPEKITFQHTVLCQTALPYRNPGAGVRAWDRKQGDVSLRVEAGSAQHPETSEWVELGLPYGPKARLVLMHINAEAIKQQSAEIELDDSMTAFMKRLQSRKPTGPEIRKFKEQIGNLSAATLRFAGPVQDRQIQVNATVIEAFDLWFPKNEKQRVLWPSTIQLSERYFQSLMMHAVPLDERAIAGLQQSAKALDVYCWLAQRLHRVPERGQFIPWTALKEQFGQGIGRMDHFRAQFLDVLGMVQCAYPASRFTTDRQGMTLKNSPPPVRKRMVMVKK